MKKTSKLYLFLLAGAVITGSIVLSVPEIQKFITTSVVSETILEQKVAITIPADAPPGDHTFNITVEDGQIGDTLAQSEPVTIKVLGPTDSGEETSGDEGGGGSGGVGGDAAASINIVTYPFAPERGHQTSGSNTTIVEDQERVVARLAGNTSTVSKVVRVTRENYWLYITARHDQPEPVQVAVYIDGQAWKVLTMEQGDNKYRIHQVGLLRSFAGSEISFKFINDVYDRQDVTNEVTDRNFFIDAWALSTDPKLDKIRAPQSGVVKGAKTTGAKLLPRLNAIIREELGERFVTWDIWSYYAPRLVAQPNRREAIGTEDRLRTVMKFWRAASPQKPRGL